MKNSWRRADRLILVILLVALACFGRGTAAAAPLPWQTDRPYADRPYRVTVGLRFSDDPIFTRFYVESVQGQVRDQLTNFFGTLAEVDVAVDHPLLKQLETTDLADLALGPDEFAEQGIEDKLFLMVVEFDYGIYRVRWRQVDGDVQYVGPLYSQETPDRHWLGKLIALAVKQDFAPTAEVEPTGPEGVRLEFRGARRSPRLRDGTSLLKPTWLEPGSVLQLFQVSRRSDGSYLSQLVPHTLLRIEAGSDASEATVISSLQDPLQRRARAAGFLAMKVTTQTGRFRLRLVDPEDGSPVLDASVSASDRGFDEIGDADRLPPPDRDGVVTADRDFDRLAYVSVDCGSKYNVLLPITGDMCEQECKVSVRPGARQRSDWQRRLRYAVQDIQVLQAMLDDHVREVNSLHTEKRYEPALTRIQEGRKSLRPLIKAAEDNVERLQAEAARLDVSSTPRLAWVVQQLETIKRRDIELGALATDLSTTIDNIDAQNRAKVLVRLADQALAAGNVDDAIEKYEAAMAEWDDLPQVKRRLAELRQVWELKGAEHQEARSFVYAQWTNARVRDLAGLMDDLKRHFNTLRSVDDYLTIQRMAVVCDTHLRELAEIVELLEGRGGEENRQEFEKYEALAEELALFRIEQISAYLRERGERGQPTTGPVADVPAEPVPAGGSPAIGPPDLDEEEEEPL